MTKTIATSTTCGPCTVLKNKIKQLNLTVEVKELSTENMDWFIKHSIKSVPRLVIEDGDNVEIIQGIDDIIAAIQKSS
jgi:hypothetical protein